MKQMIRMALLAILLSQGCSFTQKIKTGLQAYEVKQYAVAADLFQKEFESSKVREDKAKLAFLAAECFTRLNRQADAAKWYDTAWQEGFGPDAQERYAQALKRQEKYMEAIQVYEQMASSAPGNARYRSEITTCRQALEWKNNSHPDYQIEPVSFNTTSAEYAPHPIGPGKVVFTSDRNSKHNSETYPWTGRSYADLYVWNKTSNAVEEFDARINSADNDGTAIVSPDGNMLVFTRCFVDQTYDAWCKLMISYRRGNQWTSPVTFPFIQEKVNYGQPAFAANGTTLFFSSDVKGGQGGHDLYYTQLDDQGNWNMPVNLGSLVNSAGDELYPTVYKDTLFFSSDHFAGLGGLDIFKTWLDRAGAWVPPQNLRAPVNSGGDDFSYVIDTFSKPEKNILVQGYFTSSRDGASRNDDIYAFAITKPEGVMADAPGEEIPAVQEENTPVQKLFLAVRVLGQTYEIKDDPNSARASIRPLPNGPIIISQGVMDRRMVTDDLGQLLFELEWNTKYIFTARYRDHLAAAFELNTAEVEKKPNTPIVTVNHTFILEPVIKNKEIVLENIFYDYDQWSIREDAKPSLNNLSRTLKTNPGIRIQLTSHTDCRGTEEYNLELSQKRAQAAIEYLQSTGIPAIRLVAAGLGESSPAVLCDCESCTEEQHQTNRRTTFKIID
jgi:outer membrane protein OmpA-like peptidoglycan-associated protein/tetratricopeptide (TPR) repeat protein